MATHRLAPSVGLGESDTASKSSHLSVSDLGVLSFWHILSRRWLFVVGGICAGWVLAVVHYLVIAPTYESSSKVLVTRKDPTIAASGIGRKPEAEAPQVTEELLATHVELLRSGKIVSEALERNGLHRAPSILERINTDEGQTPADYVIENLYVTRGGEGPSQDAHILNVAFRHGSAADAQGVVQAIVKRYQQFLVEEFTDVNQEAAHLIDQAQGDLAGELKSLEEKYRQFREQSPLFWDSQQGMMNSHRVRYEQIQQELAKLDVRVSEARSRLDVAQASLKEMDERGALDIERMSLIDAGNAQRLNLLVDVQEGESRSAQFLALQSERAAAAQAQYQSLLDLTAEEKALLEKVGPAHPDVVSTRDRIAVVRDFLGGKSDSLLVDKQELLSPRRLVDAYIALLQHDLVSAAGQQADLQARSAAEEEAAKLAVKYELEHEALRGRLDRTQQLYTAVVDRLREINLAKEYQGFVHEVIAAPRLGRQVWPNLLIGLVLGTLVGLVLGSAGVAVAEVRDRAFRSPAEIQKSLALPVLAHVPSLAARSRRGAVPAEGSGIDPLVCTLHRPSSREAEVFRGLRTALASKARERPMQVLAVTSLAQGDGSSIVLANLAVSMAQTGRRVLLIDCNMRVPRLHHIFGLENRVGLSGVVAGQVEVLDAIQSTGANNVSVLTSGPAQDDPGEWLTSPTFQQLIALARDRYDHVLLDCAPVLAVSDACIVAPNADSTLLVFRVTQHDRSQALRATEMLRDVGANLVGSVVNVWGIPRRGFGYRNCYNYHGANGKGAERAYRDLTVQDKRATQRAG